MMDVIWKTSQDVTFLVTFRKMKPDDEASRAAVVL